MRAGRCARSPGRRSRATRGSRSATSGAASERRRSGTSRPGEIVDLPLPWDRLTEIACWWPDAKSVLLYELRDGRSYLHRFDLETGEIHALPMRAGSLTGARVRPDGSVWYRLQHGEQPGRRPRGRPRGAGARRASSRSAGPAVRARGRSPNEEGDRVQGWLVEPDGPKPWPTLFFIHGGPTSVDLDRWSPEVQAYVDAGFAVAQLNYRGSIGFGAAWRDALIGNIGWPEVSDIVAGHDDLLAKGIADPARSVIAGWSWGGYLTLLMHGMHPERFICGVAGVPVADYESAYKDESPLLQAYDRALFGGDPADAGDLLHERSPMTYVDNVTAPLLILAGEHDSRCPLPQILNYVERLKAQGATPTSCTCSGPATPRSTSTSASASSASCSTSWRRPCPASRACRACGATPARPRAPRRPCRRSPGPRARSIRPRSRVIDPAALTHSDDAPPGRRSGAPRWRPRGRSCPRWQPARPPARQSPLRRHEPFAPRAARARGGERHLRT